MKSATTASDIGVGLTNIDTSGSSVIQPRTDTLTSGFDYDPSTITATNGLTPYLGMSAGQATVADMVATSNLTILGGTQIAQNDNLGGGGSNYILVTMKFAVLPQYFTPATVTINVALTIENGQ